MVLGLVNNTALKWTESVKYERPWQLLMKIWFSQAKVQLMSFESQNKFLKTSCPPETSSRDWTRSEPNERSHLFNKLSGAAAAVVVVVGIVVVVVVDVVDVIPLATVADVLLLKNEANQNSESVEAWRWDKTVMPDTN